MCPWATPERVFRCRQKALVSFWPCSWGFPPCRTTDQINCFVVLRIEPSTLNMYTLTYTFLLLLRVGGASLCSPGYPGAYYVEQASFCPMRGVHHHTQQVFYSLQTSLSFGNFCSNRNGSKARVYFFAFSLKKNCLFVCLFVSLKIWIFYLMYMYENLQV